MGKEGCCGSENGLCNNSGKECECAGDQKENTAPGGEQNLEKTSTFEDESVVAVMGMD